MPIPESQLETWSHQGSIAQSSTTYNSIKNVLEASTTPYAGKSFNVFLQGSYGNATNIYAESDVDIVICLNDCFYSDLNSLTDEEKIAHKQAFSDAKYTLAMFKEDVLNVLRTQYTSAVHAGAKAIAIDASESRRKADVIVSCQFRRYSYFRSPGDSAYVDGICFFNSSGERIANYPKQHSTNLTARHQASSQHLKPMVRVLKNMRSRLVEDGKIEAGTAPSYYLEGLLYNVPIAKLTGSYQNCVVNVLNWYLQDAQKSELVCANEQYYLLRDGSHTCWAPANCDAFVNAAVKLWNEW
ncbi:nucleotidyltransferase [Arthrobacter sp. NPDC080086]|uniref:nucleotidyltransferase domain-containing protein n=1 Tax=Arthrobacter sp. NPDC080086 TaxID=3155917 RepID=UPI0034506D86